jgi:hypothetical protein
MTEALGPAAINATGKGFSVMFGWPEHEEPDPNAKARVLGITYKSKAGRAGQVLNVCPWCEAPIKFYPPSPVSQPVTKEGSSS